MPLSLNMKILIVDDSGTMRLMFKQMLLEVGFSNLILAVNGKDAIKKIEGQKLDLIISDWNMPEMDGLEFLQWVRKKPEYDEVPFVMATAQSDKAQQNLVYQNGGNSHIAKPFDYFELKATIDESFGLESKAEKRAKLVREGEKVVLKAGHIQITDHLALGVLKHRIDSGEITPSYFELETECMSGWNPVQQALESDMIDVGFVLAPIAMDLYAYDTKIKMVSLAHKNGSTFIRNEMYRPENYWDMKNYYQWKEVDIPHKMSVHHILAYKFLKDLGLNPGVPGKRAINVRFEVMPPVKMPEIMDNEETIGGFVVAEPVGSNAVAKNIGNLEFKSSEMWPDHPCCVVVFQEDFINKHEKATYEFVRYLIETGLYIESNKDKVAKIALDFLDPDKSLGLTEEILSRVLKDEGGIKMDDLYPIIEDLDSMQHYMHDEMKIGSLIDVDEFCDLRFIERAAQEIDL